MCVTRQNKHIQNVDVYFRFNLMRIHTRYIHKKLERTSLLLKFILIIVIVHISIILLKKKLIIFKQVCLQYQHVMC